MSIYRFVGDTANITNPTFNFRRFGQKAEMDDALARVVAKRVPLIPEAEFEATGITEGECTKYPTAISHMNAPDEFKQKKKAALIALAEFRETLNAPPEGV